MTDNTKSITLKLQAAKRELDHGVFLGNFTYAAFDPLGVTLTDEDGSGHVLDKVRLSQQQLDTFVGEVVERGLV